MAESLVGKIVGNAGKQWSRNTVADGNWLNSNTVQKFNENDKTLAEAIESVSAAMEHFTPEITPSAWPCAANKTIQNIEQNADGSLNVTYQPIESSTTSDESLWSWYKQNAYDSVLAVYTETHNDINHEDGELSTSLTIPEGIYDVKIEVLYEPTQSTINNKLDIAISKSTSIDDALYQTFILFDDSLIKDTTSNPQKIDEQSQWITGIIDLAESTTLKFLIKGESAQGRYKLNNIYINSIGGAAGPEGPQGPTGPTGPTGPEGPTGPQGISLSAKSSTVGNVHTVEIWQEGASTAQTTFNVLDGAAGDNGRTPEFQIDLSNAHWQWKYTDEQNWTDTNVVASGTQGPKGDDGDKGDQGDKGDTGAAGADGITPSGSYAPKTEGGVDGTEVSFKYSSTGTDPRDFSFFVPNGQSTGATQILGGNGIEAVKAQGEEKYTISFSGGNFQNLSAGSATNAYEADGYHDTQAGHVSFSQAFNTLDTTKLNTSTYAAQSGMFVTSASDTFQNAGQYGIIKDTNGIHWGEIDDGTGKYVEKTGDTMTGPLVVNSTTNHPIVGISQHGDSDDFAVFGATRKKSNNNFGTTWLGVGQDGQGVLKNIPNTSTSAATEPASNGAYTQITFSQNNNAVPSIDVNAKLNGSDHNYKSVVVPQQSYNNMSAFDATNGPNYMLRKLNDGSFDIGACVINVTDIPQNTEANTYYFVYDV